MLLAKRKKLVRLGVFMAAFLTLPEVWEFSSVHFDWSRYWYYRNLHLNEVFLEIGFFAVSCAFIYLFDRLDTHYNLVFKTLTVLVLGSTYWALLSSMTDPLNALAAFFWIPAWFGLVLIDHFREKEGSIIILALYYIVLLIYLGFA